MKDFEFLIGLNVDEAENYLEDPYYIRVVKKDGVNYVVTCDFVVERINVVVENEIITEVNGVG